MAIEKKWAKVPPESFTADGTTDGHITVVNSELFYVKQEVRLFSDDLSPIIVEIKRINSRVDIEVGPKGNINQRTDVSGYLLADNAMISAEEQVRPTISWEDIRRAVYEEEPTVALRTTWVDKLGNKYGDDNPIPVAFDGTIDASDVRTTAVDNDPKPGDLHSSVRIGDGTNEAQVTSGGALKVFPVTTGAMGETVNTYTEVSSVAAATLTTVVTYTVPASTTAVLEKINSSGTNLATYQVFVNADVIDTKRTHWGGGFNALFDFISNGAGYGLVAGDVVTLKIIHDSVFLGDFEGRIQVVESPV